jgi:hypothetical protein
MVKSGAESGDGQVIIRIGPVSRENCRCQQVEQLDVLDSIDGKKMGVRENGVYGL